MGIWCSLRSGLCQLFVISAILDTSQQSSIYGRHPDSSTETSDTPSFCQVGTLEDINNSIWPHLQALLGTSFFRYFKLNLNRPCPFWKEDLICTSQGCAIETLPKDPNGWESKLSDIQFPTFQLINSVYKAWEYDEDDFCLLDRDGEDGVYVDLIENPERFTGYAGPSANKVWQSIYQENCFAPESQEPNSLLTWKRCVESQVFYRVISGLHASISVHLSDMFYNQKTKQWESQFDMFFERVGKHVDRVQNLYLVYMLLYRAVCRVYPKLSTTTFNNEDSTEDGYIRELLTKISKRIPHCPAPVEDPLFSADTKPEVIEEFKDHFRNVTRIMNCVSCERCRLWGKIQTTGIGTALKILFLSDNKVKWQYVNFRRSEIIALFNTFGRLSESVKAIEKFRTFHEKLEKERLFSIHGILDRALTFILNPLVSIFSFAAIIVMYTVRAIVIRRRKYYGNKKSE